MVLGLDSSQWRWSCPHVRSCFWRATPTFDNESMGGSRRDIGIDPVRRIAGVRCVADGGRRAGVAPTMRETCQASTGSDAIFACSRAIDSHCAARRRAFATLYFYRGLAWQRQGDDAKAIDDYLEAGPHRPDQRRCVQQSPLTLWRPWGIRRLPWRIVTRPSRSIRNMRPHIKIAAAPMATTETAERAVADCDMALSLQPNYQFAYLRPRVAHYRNRNFDRAIDDYSAAIRLDPTDLFARKNRGFAYYRRHGFRSRHCRTSTKR